MAALQNNEAGRYSTTAYAEAADMVLKMAASKYVLTPYAIHVKKKRISQRDRKPPESPREIANNPRTRIRLVRSVYWAMIDGSAPMGISGADNPIKVAN